jgi:ferredoxin-NADP reductase
MMLRMQISAIEAVTSRVKRFVLSPCDVPRLPAFSGGSHIVLAVDDGGVKFRNPYSLIGSSDRTSSYQIAVQLEPNSRGGSSYLHGLGAPGRVVSVSLPYNSFPLVRTAKHHLFIAGGIGITPILALIEDAVMAGASWEFHYCIRTLADGALATEVASRHSKQVTLYPADQTRLQLQPLLSGRKLGTHLYVCGPERLIQATKATAAILGWPSRYLHSERFQATTVGPPFTVWLSRSGRRLEVESGASLLETLEAAGIDIPSGCRGGACGVCETAVLEGEIDHHDHYLSEESKRLNQCIMPCVSRARSERLVLDL